MKYTLTFTFLLFALFYSSQAQTNTTAILETTRDVSFCVYGLTGIYNEVVSMVLVQATTSTNALVAKYYEVYQNVVTMIIYISEGEVPSALLLGVSIWTTLQDLYSDFTLYLPECFSLVSPLWGGSS